MRQITRRRRRKARRWHTAVIVIAAVVAVILSPILLPIALYSHAQDEKRMRALVKTFACLSCGRMLGADALQLADEAWSDYTAKLTREFAKSGLRARIVKTFDAICPYCGTYHKFIPKQRTFVLARVKEIPLKPGENEPSAIV